MKSVIEKLNKVYRKKNPSTYLKNLNHLDKFIKNRENLLLKLKLPKKYKKVELNINNGSVAVMSPLTLHKTIENKHNEIRIALPITIKNFYYPNTGNSDLNHFKKINFSVFSNLRKALGNPHLTPYRTFHLAKTKKID